MGVQNESRRGSRRGPKVIQMGVQRGSRLGDPQFCTDPPAIEDCISNGEKTIGEYAKEIY